jgi:signal transduction histidine kinase
MILIEIIFNLALLLAYSVVSGFLLTRWKKETRTGIILQGLLFGSAALLGMLNPFVFAPGIIFDGRSVVLSLCTLFFGPVAGFISTFIALIYRIYLGGSGAVMGVSVILASYLIGVLYRYRLSRSGNKISNLNLYVFGLAVSLAMLIMLVLIPSEFRLSVFKISAFSIIIVYPLATLLIGKILNDQQANMQLIKEVSVNEQQFRSLVNNMQQGLAVLKVLYDEKNNPCDFEFEYINSKYTQITGLQKEDLLGNTILSVRPSTSKRTIARFSDVAISGTPIHFESYSHAKKIHFEVDVYQPIADYFAVILTDITHRKFAEKELLENNKSLKKLNFEKDKLFSIVKHDLRSPLNGIIGLTGMIREDIDSFSKDHLRDIADSIYNSASSISQLLAGLVDWYKLQHGSMVFAPAPILLHEVAGKSIDSLADHARAKSIVVSNTIPENVTVFADADMVMLVIHNLLSNAIKFTPKQGQVVIGCSNLNHNDVTISVTDDGIGMSQTMCQKLFCFNENISRKGTEGELSSGLGLLLCKELIERNKGEIWAESEERKGSSFYFKLWVSNDSFDNSNK